MATGIVGEFENLKATTTADLLAMQMGDFYEFFGEDAELVGEELDLKVSERSSGGEPYKMAGVPVDEITPYLKALVERGYRVAIADQRETDDGIVRELTRTVTPGTLLETDDAEAQYLASVTRVGGTYGLAFCDITTGRFRVTTVSGEAPTERALNEIDRHDPVEVLPGPSVRTGDDVMPVLTSGLEARLTLHETDDFAPGRARQTLEAQFGEAADTVGLPKAAIAAAGATIAYVDSTGVGVLASMTRLESYTPDDHVTLDGTTRRNLELTSTMTGEGRTLFETVDHTATNAGARLLGEWLTRPLRDAERLRRRQAGVEALLADAIVRDGLSETLREAYDLERVAARAVSGSADADVLLRARETLALVPELIERIDASPRLAESPIGSLFDDLDHETIDELREELAALADDPPTTLHDGGLIKRGYDEELDALVARQEAARGYFDTLEDRERKEHGFSRVTVDRNKTDGYYVQLQKSESASIPDHYEGIKTLKNAERYVFDELRERERELFRLEDERGEREYEAFCRLREAVADHAECLQAVGRALAELDVRCSLAAHAAKQGWTRPTLCEDRTLAVEAGRHPVVETDTQFVPNDLTLDPDRRFLLVTGPNMSGKSTYMRQAALITLLAQTGSFVPADRATIGLVDGIYTRVGALDELAEGRSTFMVEMEELSNILHSATDESLVVLDEVGRGTATHDGISIAWATTEYLHNEIGAFTLFATHYHELTALAEELPRVENVHVAASETDGDVTFLRTVEAGPTDRSYGVHVADLAGVPGPVVDRAANVLDRLRDERAIEAKGAGADDTVQTVFDLDAGEFRTAEPKERMGTRGENRASPASDADRTDLTHTESEKKEAATSREASRNDSGVDETESGSQGVDPDVLAVLEDLRTAELPETSPVELMNRVREWQQRLEDE